ncbi:BLUF domain-containing protein [Microlunatus flavus]|uniref:Sensors of blue-light using FAD n=1 Tax=Microlunatus flavus TaxID=1036181 RepID=A0A1H8ZI04_9ACTN|nr:BLUF domain-containing protein [Microlunatus flavus]SEP63867.1 Sensors of blue-light using FAD [Microlunatus flavus]
MLFSLVYTSRATSPMTRDALVELLQSSRAHNSAARLTGLLLYRDGTFVQLLEGQRARVEALYASIQEDPRHHHVTTVSTGDQLERQFPGWSMGFNDLDAEPVDLPGYSDVLDRHDDPTHAEAGFVRELLELFDTRR